MLAGHATILTLTNTQAKELAGRTVTVGAETYHFKSYDRDHPGQPPWRSGAEGKAFPLLDFDRSIAAYMKFFTRPTPKRLDRTAWLIGQQIHTWLPGLAAAPMLWGDTRHVERPDQTPFDIAGYVARAVPGTTWLEMKAAIAENSVLFRDDFRWRCVRDLLLSLAVLEEQGIMHGDLSPNNIVIDCAARPDRPALYLIDFDAFVAPAAEENAVVTVAEGGTYGTEGYCPPDLAAAVAAGDGGAAPCSDRYARDMLLMELLIMDCGLSPDDPPSSWNREPLERRCAAFRARGNPAGASLLSHLDPAALFALSDDERPSSADLAADLGLAPRRQQPRHLSRVRAVAPVVLGQPVLSGRNEPLTRRWGPNRLTASTLPIFVPWRWSRRAANPYDRTLWQDIKATLIFAIPFLLFLLAAALIAIFGK